MQYSGDYATLSIAFGLLLSVPASAEAPPSPYPIFRDQGILKDVTIEAPLSDLFSMTREAMERRQDLPKEKLPKGKVTFRATDGTSVTYENVIFSVRGNSSKDRSQCPFAKLSLKFPAGNVEASVMGALTKIKIGTHCGETEIPGEKWSRVRNQKAPIREALIYKALSRTDTISLLVRPAVITYVDTSATLDTRDVPERKMTRNAFFLEDDDTAADRYGGTILQEAGRRPSNARFLNAQDSKVDPLNIALSALAQALTKNTDWFLQMSASDPEARSMTGYSNWNVNIVQTKDGRVWSMVYDWDISSWVTGRPRGSRVEHSIRRMAANPDVKQDHLDQAIQQYILAKAQIYRDIDVAFAESGVEDAAGKANVISIVDDFYEAIAASPSLGFVPDTMR